MKLLTFVADGQFKSGVVTEHGVIDVEAAAAALGIAAPTTIAGIVSEGTGALEQIAAKAAPGEPWIFEESGLTLGPVVSDPGKIICIGLNYAKHAAESNMPIPTHPVVFSKFNNTLAGHGESVPLDTSVATEFDYEVELCVVIGKTAYKVAEDNALDHVFGYCTANDISVRDLQTRTSQWLLGKTPDKFFPIGPYLVTADEVGDPQKLRVTCTVNGETRQDSNTADMIFNVRQLVSYLSQYFPLQPGDLITTGTPEGVAMGMPNKPWLKAGDVVEVEVEGLGKLTNTMA
ncbi:MAG: fumarylacetoacetate hydrolase family protein [Chloroflexota bacterium]|jgi:2-keto-4-pentenoate hydratase/2-oxohepta-3-ene-1,7-dioic acid hydratase in catechol pathway|nr:fumarylacetoacetate hydrolase family protein [Chloroflexota bacterium]